MFAPPPAFPSLPAPSFDGAAPRCPSIDWGAWRGACTALDLQQETTRRRRADEGREEGGERGEEGRHLGAWLGGSISTRTS